MTERAMMKLLMVTCVRQTSTCWPPYALIQLFLMIHFSHVTPLDAVG